ncbi:MAM domain-containing protein [Aphelenchoides bicaudatus]|nr:MAM domain-containing protein [Aphelenchoides bicaudatus]
MIRYLFVFFLLSIKFVETESCSPPMNLQEMLPNMMPNAKTMGEATNRASVPISFMPPEGSNLQASPSMLTDPTELYCHDFDIGIKALAFWTNNVYIPPHKHFKFQTGLMGLLPRTEAFEFPSAKAILVSDIIECQVGKANLRFSYWTSPGVKIVVCVKGVDKMFPNYDYCSSPIENGDPGPAYVEIFDLSGQPFQIYIRAENFVFASPYLQGGFAILDDIESFGSKTSSGNSIQPKISIKPSNLKRQICENLNCDFNINQTCTHHLDSTQWRQSSTAIGDFMGGIPGDVTNVPFDINGHGFAYIMGPVDKARFSTRPFTVDEHLFFMFAYFKSVQTSDLRIFVRKREDTKEEMIYEAPKLQLENHRWFREVKSLQPGEYSYIAFEVSNLPMGLAIGLDRFVLLDAHRMPYCQNV